ncbi:hypothetical protein PG984_011607 [Apiospora sp. TS-2023a]
MNPTRTFFTGLEDPTPGLYILSRIDSNRTETSRIHVGGEGFQAPSVLEEAKYQRFVVQALGNTTRLIRSTKYRLNRALLKYIVVSVADLSPIDKVDGSARILHLTPDEQLTQLFRHPKLLSHATPQDINLLFNKCKGSLASPEQRHLTQVIIVQLEINPAAVSLARSILLALDLAVQISSICLG